MSFRIIRNDITKVSADVIVIPCYVRKPSLLSEELKEIMRGVKYQDQK